jgi:hypothetical protein
MEIFGGGGRRVNGRMRGDEKREECKNVGEIYSWWWRWREQTLVDS